MDAVAGGNMEHVGREGEEEQTTQIAPQAPPLVDMADTSTSRAQPFHTGTEGLDTTTATGL